MNITCKDRDRIFEDGTPEEWANLEAHAASCPLCAEELHAWRSLSAAAVQLRDYTDSPSLWLRIQRALAEQSAPDARSRSRWTWRALWPGLQLWQAAAFAAVVLLLIIVPVAWRNARPPIAVSPESPDLLRKKALADVERAESAYVQAINKLAIQAKPQLDNPETPLMASYREKLLVLDSAIDDLRVQAGQNPSNAHVRYQLLAVYQEKQRSLEEILEEKR
jgi:hypothetical protein